MNENSVVASESLKAIVVDFDGPFSSPTASRPRPLVNYSKRILDTEIRLLNYI